MHISTILRYFSITILGDVLVLLSSFIAQYVFHML